MQIKLTYFEDGSPVYVQPGQILSMKRHRFGTLVDIGEKRPIIVREQPEQISVQIGLGQVIQLLGVLFVIAMLAWVFWH